MSLRAPCVIQVLLPVTRQTPPSQLGAGAQRAEVRAGVGFGEGGGRDDLAAGQLRQQRALLLVGPVQADQFAGDLGAGAERAQPDVAARQLFGDHAHRGLAQARAAVRLGDRQAEHAQLGELAQHLVRDQVVLQVPLVRGFGVVVRVARELLADLDQHRVVERRVAEAARRRALRDQRRDARAHRAREPLATQQRDRRVGLEGAAQRAVRVERVDAEDLALAHRQSAGELPQVLAERRLQHQGLEFAELAVRLETTAPADHLVQGLAVGGCPGEAVRARLLLLQRVAGVGGCCGEHAAQFALDAVEQRAGRGQGLFAVAEQPGDRGRGGALRGSGGGKRRVHRVLLVVSSGRRSRRRPAARRACRRPAPGSRSAPCGCPGRGPAPCRRAPACSR